MRTDRSGATSAPSRGQTMKSYKKSKKTARTDHPLRPELLAAVNGGGAIWNPLPTAPPQDGSQWGALPADPTVP